MDDIRKSIVGIVAKTGSEHKYSGTGFFVEGGLILTCAHVVDAAQVTDGKIQFRIEGQKQFYDAEIIFKSLQSELDISILKPVNLAENVPALPLVMSRQCDGHSFKTFGYPQTSGFQGLHGDGTIKGHVHDNSGRDALQLESKNVTHGYSGCPVWDDEAKGVVGMVSRGFDFGLDKKLGEAVFAIPCEVLKNAYPALTMGEAPAQGWHFAHHYGDNPSFTGRLVERKMLSDWLKDNQNVLFILRAFGGFGKSALAWYWLHNDVSPKQFKKVVWWSFYEGDASFDNFLSDTLEYLGIKDVKTMTARQQVSVLLGQLQDADILLVLDGFERTLRAFSGMGAVYQGDESPLPSGEGKGEGESRGRDCVSPAAEDFLRGLCDAKLRGKVLMTTRLRPHVLERQDCSFQPRCCEEELKALQPADAYEFFIMKEKIKATRAEVEAACKPYEYHPLSLNLLAGLIKKDFEYPRDIKAAEKYKLSDIKNHKEHILKASYETMPADLQQLLSKIACFRGSVDYATLKTVFGADHLDEALNDLQERGLLQVAGSHLLSGEGPEVMFDLHPIVRRYAYDCLAASDRLAAHQRLANYFEAVPEPVKVEKLDDLASVIELYHHMVRAGKVDDAFVLFRDRLSPHPLYFQFGAYQLIAELLLALFPDGENKPPRLKDKSAQAWTLNELANAYSLSGQSRRAVPLIEMVNALLEKAGYKKNLASGLGNTAIQQWFIGALTEAERNLRRRIDLSREIADEWSEAVGYQELGKVLSYLGVWQEAEQVWNSGLSTYEKMGDVQSQSVIWSYRALRFLLMARANPQSSIECASRALKLAEERHKNIGRPNIRDYIRAYWLLGAAYCANNDLTLAEENLSKALNLCRQINSVDTEADILLDLARLSFAYGLREVQPSAQDKLFEEAKSRAEEALVITERSGYVLQGADVNLFLAQYALEQEKDKAKAKEYAESALKLATCDGPPYYYKVAYEEAQAMLKELK